MPKSCGHCPLSIELNWMGINIVDVNRIKLASNDSAKCALFIVSFQFIGSNYVVYTVNQCIQIALEKKGGDRIFKKMRSLNLTDSLHMYGSIWNMRRLIWIRLNIRKCGYDSATFWMRFPIDLNRLSRSHFFSLIFAHVQRNNTGAHNHSRVRRFEKASTAHADAKETQTTSTQTRQKL